jgi:periplasmic divalent cation tolerance protein
MADEVLIAFCTFPDSDTAQTVAREVVQLRLAACANIVPNVRSIYRWQGEIESSDEALAIFKLTAAGYAEFENKIRLMHPYEVPEIVAFPLSQGLPAYLKWVSDSCR